MKTRMMAMLLSLIMVLTCLSVTAFAETELTVGENPVLVPAGEEDYFRTVYFTPELSGYYLIDVDWEEPALCWAEAETMSDGEYDYYIMDAGVTYEVTVVNMDEVEAEYIVYIEYFQEVQILTPVSLEITKLPNNTTYLESSLENVWESELFEGMEMEVTWEDETVTTWTYETDDTWIGAYYLEWMIDVSEEKAMVILSVPELELEPVSFELTLLDFVAESIELVDSSALEIVEKSCGMDLKKLGVDIEGWYYLPIAAYTREIMITFSDGSTVTALPGDIVYGVEVTVADNQGGAVVMQAEQPEGFWAKDTENLIVYCYGELETVLTVEIIDSPVENIEIVTPPTNDTLMMDEDMNLFNADGEAVETIRQLFEGISLKVAYKDGSTKAFTAGEIEWIVYEGEEYPFVDGYPIGILNGMLGLLEEEMVPPCEIEIAVEYMGAQDTYTLSIVEEFEEEPEDDPIEEIPETGDESVAFPAVVVIAMMSVAVMVVAKKKYF